MIQLKYNYAPLALGHFQSFQEKLDTVFAYLEFDTVFCGLYEGQAPDLSSTEKIDVVEILVPGGQASYIKTTIQSVIILLQDSLDEYVSNNEDHYLIRKTLESSKERCLYLSKKNDIHKNLQFDQNRTRFLTIIDGKLHKIYLSQLQFEENVSIEIMDHHFIRKEFYDELIELLDKKLADHLEIPAYPKTPYIWNSENPHLEIAELLFALVQTRIQIKEGEKGSNSKLVKQFYNLFGLDDALYHSKLQQIRNRQDKQSWLHILADYINALPKKTETS